jgi:hypothetical protein
MRHRAAPPVRRRAAPAVRRRAAPAAGSRAEPALGHRAALYAVRVRTKGRRNDYRPLGDIDERGTSLLKVLERCLDQFSQRSADGLKLLRSRNLRQGTRGTELLVLMELGEKGVAADIIDPKNTLRLRQTSSDTQYVRCGVLFQLPPAQDRGWLALHVNNGRGTKSLLDDGLSAEFGKRFDDLVLEITPFVQSAALVAAAEQGRVSTVRLVGHKPPDDLALAAIHELIPTGDWGSIELKIKSAPGRPLRLPLLGKYMGGKSRRQAKVADDEIIEFAGMVFDEAKVEVELRGGRRHTFNVESPEAGHAMTMDMGRLKLDHDGEPTETSVFSALRSALQTMR